MEADAQPTPELAPELPKLYEGRIDAVTMAQLFADLEACTELVEVRLKHHATAHARGTATLAEAHALLKSATVRAVQLTYQYEGVIWQDTLLCDSASSIRLVRIARTDLTDRLTGPGGGGSGLVLSGCADAR